VPPPPSPSACSPRPDDNRRNKWGTRGHRSAGRQAGRQEGRRCTRGRVGSGRVGSAGHGPSVSRAPSLGPTAAPPSEGRRALSRAVLHPPSPPVSVDSCNAVWFASLSRQRQRRCFFFAMHASRRHPFAFALLVGPRSTQPNQRQRGYPPIQSNPIQSRRGPRRIGIYLFDR
jgi:hypothetical protein